jgi:GNAT superfamily N-acetyltransferase
MTQSEFDAFLPLSIQQYADYMARNRAWPPLDAPAISLREHTTALPAGLATAHHHLYTIQRDGAAVGEIWLEDVHPSASAAGYIHRVYVHEPFRRCGIATDALALLEQQATALGLASLAVHLFLPNAAAVALFRNAGYESGTLKGPRLNMHKAIARAPRPPGAAA